MGGNTNKDSLWWRTRTAPPQPALAGDLAVDAVIVGAGITGLTTAFLLARAGRRVAVLEADRIGAGTTGGTSAHVTQVLDHRYKDLASKFGEDGARQVATSTATALEQIASLVFEEGIDCDFARVPGYLYAESADDAGQIGDELEAARRAGVPVERVSNLPLPFPVAAAVRFPHQARFHPTAYLAGLAAALQKRGGRIFEGTRVLATEGADSDGRCRVETAQGTVTAGAVVLATHTPAGFNLLQTAIEPMRSYVLAARLAGGRQVPDGLFWDTADPYHYTRRQPVPAASGSDWLVVGGADHPTGQREETEQSYRDLERYVRERWPVAAIEHRWSSQFYEPVDGLPFIGESPLGHNVLVATGYSGTGLVLATLAAMLLADAVAGRENPWADLYRTTRVKPLAGGPKFVSLNVGVARHFVGDRLTAPKLGDLAQVAAGEGGVFEVDGDKVAVSRSRTGEVRAVSAVCTHAGCLVHWNGAEQTWDCPCHGGRFTPRGEVLEGPPVKALKTVDVSKLAAATGATRATGAERRS
jgi:glycine/D-amino acid oxidase-like deaminating enzyme/nitrite reductase/ring-hydroxylating ferredoxin subunit